MFNTTRSRVIAIVLLLVIAVGSATVGASHFSKEETYSGIIEKLEESQTQVTKMTAATAIISTALAMVPGDATNPIADKIADMSTCFLIALCAILLEKYLLTLVGMAVFKYIIPIALILFIIYLIFGNPSFKSIGIKLICLSLAIFIAVPASIAISDNIKATNDAVNTVVSLGEVTDISSVNADLTKEESTVPDTTSGSPSASQSSSPSKPSGIWDGISNFLSNTKDTITDTVTNVTSGVATLADGAVDKVKEFLKTFTEAAAVMLITSCVIPILVFVFILWVVKLLFGINITSGNPIGSILKKNPLKKITGSGDKN